MSVELTDARVLHVVRMMQKQPGRPPIRRADIACKLGFEQTIPNELDRLLQALRKNTQLEYSSREGWKLGAGSALR
jgi:hypothetical protein